MITASVIGAVVWWFIASEPSPTAWILASLLFVYAVLGFVFLLLSLDDFFPASAIPIDAEQIPQPLLRHEPASADRDTRARLAEEITTAAKSWGIDKKAR
jgi:hypothetical protein